ncbi:MAG: phospholipid/cholesterol/gamma-HCH transport system substrate-binding protein [Pseudonocardiales bacterium]|jgi:phospholipid/cholesterol/gamma-HCH transport system substrate-binding protein|nr:phospholipid/cholesterol/gamma-HCH transport system substrate-binding protein [Pseudonocardiales bacterium]
MVKRSVMRRRRAVVLGAGVLIFFFALVTLSLISQQGLPFAPRTTVKAAFEDVGSLRTGDDVRIANIRVGYVQQVDLVDATNAPNGQSKLAVAILRLDGERPVYKNAQAITASVGARSALGQKFVELNPGDPSAGLLPADAVVPAVHTVGAQEISDVLSVLDEPTRQAIGSFVRNVGGGLAGHGRDFNLAAAAFPDVLPDLGTVSDAFSNNGGRDTASLLRSTNELSVSFIGRQEQIGQLLGKLDKTFAGFNADNGAPLAQTLQTAPDSLRQTRAALQSLDGPLANTAVAAKDLQPGGDALGRATPDFRGFLVDSRSPLDKVPGVSDDARGPIDDLKGTFEDAQPLAPMLTDAFGRGGALAQIISPFSPEASLFFTNATDALKVGNDNYHALRVDTGVGHEQAFDAISAPIRDPLQSRDPYPAPGEAAKQSQGLPGVPQTGRTGR